MYVFELTHLTQSVGHLSVVTAGDAEEAEG